MNSTQALITYDAILAITGEMLSAAQNNQWNQLILLEQECRKLTEMLVMHDQEPILDKELLQKKVKIITQILADDVKIRAITEPWMIKLQDMLNTNGRTRNLQQAYQPIDNL
ncbi:flagellar protein FliT [Nitrosomonas sp.]|uniref:flagellar protein FliT n=1 Tax=Nitrosomonas sp. TaxID=42353 RepID=UPI0025D3FFA5|nr:flagellar protein FliT [Nitrosomonas sp.]MBY0483155.1 flagellar protein FliT [Nitrosomonas sp.]